MLTLPALNRFLPLVGCRWSWWWLGQGILQAILGHSPRTEGNTSARLWHNFPEASYPTFPIAQLLMLCRFAQHILGKNMQTPNIWGISYLNRMVFSPQKCCPRPWWFNAPHDVLPLEPQPLQAPPFRSVRPWLRCLRRLRTLGRWRGRWERWDADFTKSVTVIRFDIINHCDYHCGLFKES